jgi:hypothetical protein
MGTEPPTLVSTDNVLPAVIAQALNEIKELIMTDSAAEQAQLDQLTTAISAVADHVSSASTTLSAWISQAQAAQAANQPLNFDGANAALGSLQAADGTLGGVVGQVQPQPLPQPIPDPGPPPVDVPPDAGAPVDTTGTDAGGATDGTTTDTGLPPDQPAPSF